MKESFLHYIWQNQYFNKKNLKTHDGQELIILNPGNYNLDSGPDFHIGRIRINKEEVVGHIELHIRSSDWYAHHHQHDPVYDLVILHVVWEHNRDVLRMDHSKIPTLELKKLISPHLIDRSNSFFSTLDALVCRKFLTGINSAKVEEMMSSALKLRLSQKAEQILKLYRRKNRQWNEVFYSLLIKNYGFKLNAYAFERMADILPFRIIRRHLDNLFQIESLLFGVSGLLNTRAEDDYFKDLEKEFSYLKHKYELGPSLAVEEWKFSRMRPSNFPTLRIAQFAAVIKGRNDFFNDFMEADFRGLLTILRAKPSQYWKNHYKFGLPVKNSISGMGNSSAMNLIINSIIPFKFTLGYHQHDESVKDSIALLLKDLPSENNNIIRVWKECSIYPDNAYESQGLYALFQNYCKPNRCLQCNIGHSIIDS